MMGTTTNDRGEDRELAEIHPLTQAIIDGDKAAAAELTRQCLADGEEAGAIIETRLVPGMAVIGEKFQCDEIFVPEMLIAANAMKASLAILEPLIAESGGRAPHTAVIGTVQGDLHDIGKNLVAMMWRGANIAVVDLGVNVSPEAFAAAAREHRPDIVGMSALLTTTMPHMREAVAAVRATGVPTKIVIGGAPVSQEFAAEVHADGFAADAGAAADVARALISAA
jgi:5-methyltetrahydrofolate--homocysteine methyltransferase